MWCKLWTSDSRNTISETSHSIKHAKYILAIFRHTVMAFRHKPTISWSSMKKDVPIKCNIISLSISSLVLNKNKRDGRITAKKNCASTYPCVTLILLQPSMCIVCLPSSVRPVSAIFIRHNATTSPTTHCTAVEQILTTQHVSFQVTLPKKHLPGSKVEQNFRIFKIASPVKNEWIKPTGWPWIYILWGAWNNASPNPRHRNNDDDASFVFEIGMARQTLQLV